MSRKSSIHFKPVSNVRFAVSHSERTDLSEPAYLLPKEHQLDNVVVAGSLPENELSALFIQQKEGMSRQAKTAGASPFWEGVVVLSDTDSKTQSENLQVWKLAYEKATGHRVLHTSIHLDEGYIDDAGKPQYNPHAHVIVSRMDEKNRVIHLDRKQLATVQDLTAETLKMERGSTLEERQGRRGRKHIDHKEFRQLTDEARSELDVEKAKASEVPELKSKITKQAEEIDRYRLERVSMKASGMATQEDYQRVKKSHQATLAKLAIAETELKSMAIKIKILKADNEKLEADKARFSTMAADYQQHIAQGKEPVLFMPDAITDAAHHAKLAIDLQAKASEIRGQVARGEKTETHSPVEQKPMKEMLLAVLDIDDTSTAAFKDLGISEEAAQVVRGAADFLEQGWNGKSFDLRDTNGNKVGKCEAVRASTVDRHQPMRDGAIRLVLPVEQTLVLKLRMVADKLHKLVLTGTERLTDSMGNLIARLDFQPPPPIELDEHEVPKGP